MSRQRNQNDGNLKDILRRLYRLERQSMLAHSAIGREGLEVYDGGWIRILNGGLEVIGTATISGVLDVTGTFNASGDNNLSGTNDLTGPTTISGTLGITGDTTVAGNFEITTGGLFKSGTVEISPDGSADFGDLHIDSTGKLTSGQFELNPDGSAKFGLMTIDADGKITTGDTVIDTAGRAEFGDFVIDPASNFPIQAPGGRMVSNGTNQIGLDTLGASILLDSNSSTIVNGTTVLSLGGGLADLLGSLRISSAPSAPAADLIPLGIDANGNVRRIA